MKQLFKEIIKKCPTNAEEEMLPFVEDTLRHLEDEENEEHETNEGILGMRNTFRGCFAKVLIDANFAQKKYHKLNRITVRLSMEYYCRHWIERNKKCHYEIL